jgi:YHS domain-containing protein
MKPLTRIVLVTVLIGALLIPSLTFSQELKIRQSRPDEIGMKAWCPVMDYNFEVKASTSVIDYKGKSFYFCCEGCPAEFKNNPDKYLVRTEFRDRRPTPQEIGKEATCTVMNHKFKITANTPVIDYHGKSYFFCCEGCPSEFKRNPGKYAVQ